MSAPLSLPRLTPLARRGGLIVITTALALLLLAALPYVWHASLSEQASARSAELALLKEKARARAAARGPALGPDDPVESMFLPGTTPGTTLAAFQSLVSDAAAASGLNVLRLQPLPTDEVEGLSPHRLAVDAAGSLAEVQSFLVDVEAMLPIVIVTGFDIQPRAAQASGEQPHPSEDLAISLRLEAYAWRAAP
jgi:hypothetical protein